MRPTFLLEFLIVLVFQPTSHKFAIVICFLLKLIGQEAPTPGLYPALSPSLPI